VPHIEEIEEVVLVGSDDDERLGWRPAMGNLALAA
jgi:hypothetical protein